MDNKISYWLFVVHLLSHGLIEQKVYTRDGRPAPPRGKTGCPAPPRKKQALPRPPRPAKLTKSAGHSGAKLTADSIDTPFYYARD